MKHFLGAISRVMKEGITEHKGYLAFDNANIQGRHPESLVRMYTTDELNKTMESLQGDWRGLFWRKKAEG